VQLASINTKTSVLICCAAACAFGQNWVQTIAPVSHWDSVASSADGSNLVAVAWQNQAGNFGGLFVSTNSGATWSDTSPSHNDWMSVASSADGRKLVAVEGFYEGGPIYLSTNSGANWMQSSAPSNYWSAVCSSADGQKLIAASPSTYADGLIYRSTDGGGSWAPTSAPSLPWVSLVSSADGSKLMATASMTACAGLGCGSWSAIYISRDGGASWVAGNVSGIPLSSSACSADGTRLVALGGSTILSTNSGGTWYTNVTVCGAGVAATPDGTRLLVASAGFINVSTDWGTTWTSLSLPTNVFPRALAVCADGSRLLLASSDSYLYQLISTPRPRLNLHVVDANALLAWSVPSRSFVLQRSSDMGNWIDENVAPSFSLSNIEFEVTVPASSKLGFYRMKSN
jgi:hypothetical protein